MPELAEVEFYRRRWWETGAHHRVRTAQTRPESRVFRLLAAEFPGGAAALAGALRGARLVDSGTHGKQMWFALRRDARAKPNAANAAANAPARRRPARAAPVLWLGLHLGMSGELRVEPPAYPPARHDALVLKLERATLVFSDPRQFGRVRAWTGAPGEVPPWLRALPPALTAPAFTLALTRAALARHARAPLKAVLLQQEHFPGVGNWMADEILWRAALHPALPAGRAAQPATARRLHATIRKVARDALRTIAGLGGPLPPDLNANIPNTWLFHHRWRDGGQCPRTHQPLQRAEIAGRTTCWSPARQPAPRGISKISS